MATQFVSLAHAEYALSSELLEQRVHSVGKRTEVWVGPGAKAKHREPIRDIQKMKKTKVWAGPAAPRPVTEKLQERDMHINTQVRGLLAWNLEQTHLNHTDKECGCSQGWRFRNENITHKNTHIATGYSVYKFNDIDVRQKRTLCLGIPDVSERSCALKVGFMLRFIAGGLPSVRV